MEDCIHGRWFWTVMLLNCLICTWLPAHLTVCGIWQFQVEEFLKQVNTPVEEATSQKASPQDKVEGSSTSSDSEDQDSVTTTRSVRFSIQNPEPLPSSVSGGEPGTSKPEEEVKVITANSADGQGTRKTECGSGRVLVPMDIPDYLREETEDVSPGIPISYKLDMNWQFLSQITALCAIYLCCLFKKTSSLQVVIYRAVSVKVTCSWST